MSVSTEIRKMEGYKESLDFLLDATKSYTMEWNLEYYVHEVKNAAILRRLLLVFGNAYERIRVKNTQAEDLVAEVETGIIEATEEITKQGTVEGVAVLEEVEADYERILREGWKGYTTGFSKIDQRTGGLFLGHIWAVGAYTGTGKTYFLLQLVLNLLSQGAKIVFFSTEMDKKMMIIRMLSNLSGIGPLRILRGEVDEMEMAELNRAKQVLRSYQGRLFIYDNVFTVQEIRLKYKKHKLKDGCDVVFLDYIQNMVGGSSYDTLATLATDLQKMVRELEPLFIMSSQISQDAANARKGETIKLKGAGEIAAISDVILWLRNNDKKNEEIQRIHDSVPDLGGYSAMESHKILSIRKVRHGLVGSLDMVYKFPSGQVFQTGDEVQQQEEGADELSADDIGT